MALKKKKRRGRRDNGRACEEEVHGDYVVAISLQGSFAFSARNNSLELTRKK